MGKGKGQEASRSGQLRVSASGIHNDDAGIFVTCDKGQEANCLREMDDLLSQHTEASDGVPLWGHGTVTDAVEAPSPTDDIESDIRKELDSLRSPSAANPSIHWVKLDIPCVSFVKTGPDLDPVTLVHSICKEASAKPDLRRSRYIKRMTPMTLMRKTLPDGLDKLCQTVLKPHFHAGGPSRKFAIRPTIRNNNSLHRDDVINQIATAVGPHHRVDLKNYDLLILLDVYRNVCGMSVVGADYERLKGFNLAEIYHPIPKPPAVPRSSASAFPPDSHADASGRLVQNSA